MKKKEERKERIKNALPGEDLISSLYLILIDLAYFAYSRVFLKLQNCNQIPELEI